AVNVLAIENILETPFINRPTIIHISTDYVFDGEHGNYRETDTPNPRGNYARSKMAAENILNSAGFEYIIVRTQVLFGSGQNVRPNFVTWLINNLREKKTVQVVNDQIGCPSYAPDVAEALFRLLEKQAYGLFHVSSPDALSRYDFALQVAHIFELDVSLIHETTTEKLKQKSPRPMNSSFILDKLFNNINWQPRSVKEALHHMKTEVE
ncbi:MAG TPA: SDR family oxidoreductase, partial [Calditrichaeota bacterium]|nr:SDR family oxidoreductase [Calditrichota bacterium]